MRENQLILGRAKKVIAEEKAEYVNLYLHQITVLAVRTTGKAELCQQSLFNFGILHYLILCLRH